MLSCVFFCSCLNWSFLCSLSIVFEWVCWYRYRGDRSLRGFTLRTTPASSSSQQNISKTTENLNENYIQNEFRHTFFLDTCESWQDGKTGVEQGCQWHGTRQHHLAHHVSYVCEQGTTTRIPTFSTIIWPCWALCSPGAWEQILQSQTEFWVFRTLRAAIVNSGISTSSARSRPKRCWVGSRRQQKIDRSSQHGVRRIVIHFCTWEFRGRN